ncbi:hypothetical protein [Pseudomonas sp. BNK-15]|uniref:hypothetical protein n=1 Tax=Pseudomonas sp. BNK-15 TaxID=3376152 RepID=UPI0039BF55AD
MNEALQPLYGAAQDIVLAAATLRQQLTNEPVVEHLRLVLMSVEGSFADIDLGIRTLPSNELLKKFNTLARTALDAARQLQTSGNKEFQETGAYLEGRGHILMSHVAALASNIAGKEFEITKSELATMKAEIDDFAREQRDKLQDLHKQIGNEEVRASKLGVEISGLEGLTHNERQKIHDAFRETQDYLDSRKAEILGKEKELNQLIGRVTGTAMSNEYDRSARSEMVRADWLRYAALFCMLAMVVIVGFSAYETLNGVFDWSKALARFSFVLVLSVPAAYLARESTKHRLQQYNHLQTSLDIAALPLFIGSLQSKDQDKVTAAIALKLFASREQTTANGDSYPVNVHELLMEIIKKLEVPSTPVAGK